MSPAQKTPRNARAFRDDAIRLNAEPPNRRPERRTRTDRTTSKEDPPMYGRISQHRGRGALTSNYRETPFADDSMLLKGEV